MSFTGTRRAFIQSAPRTNANTKVAGGRVPLGRAIAYGTGDRGGASTVSRRRTARQALGPTGGAWDRIGSGEYRHQETGYTVTRVGSLWHVWGGYWDGAAFTSLWAAQTQVEGAGRLGAYRTIGQD